MYMTIMSANAATPHVLTVTGHKTIELNANNKITGWLNKVGDETFA